jgi:chemotaxis protein methyltransferase CheR
MTEQEFILIRQFVEARTGIVIGADKRYLVETRLEPVARALGHGSLSRLAAQLVLADRALEQAVIDAMTTNETLFFRDTSPFELFEQIMLPNLLKRRTAERRLRIWSAACSTGQEAYSLAMILQDWSLRMPGVQTEIIGTDISEKALAQARAGLFSHFEAQRGLPINRLLRHFAKEGNNWRIEEKLRQAVAFRSLNLLQPFRHLGTFDIIYCRNVMIYFNEATRRDLLARLAQCLAPDGYLLLGGAETVFGLSADFVPHAERRGLYVMAGSAEAQVPGKRRAQR